MIARNFTFAIIIALSTALAIKGAAISPVNLDPVAVKRDIPFDYAVVAQFQPRAVEVISRSDKNGESSISEVQKPIFKSACHDIHNHHNHLNHHNQGASGINNGSEDSRNTTATNGSEINGNEGHVENTTATTTDLTASASASASVTHSSSATGTSNATTTATSTFPDITELPSDSSAVASRSGAVIGLAGFAVAILLI